MVVLTVVKMVACSVFRSVVIRLIFWSRISTRLASDGELFLDTFPISDGYVGGEKMRFCVSSALSSSKDCRQYDASGVELESGTDLKFGRLW